MCELTLLYFSGSPPSQCVTSTTSSLQKTSRVPTYLQDDGHDDGLQFANIGWMMAGDHVLWQHIVNMPAGTYH